MGVMALQGIADLPVARRTFTRELCPWTRFSLAEILVLDDGAILPAPAVPASSRISARVTRVQGHCSPVNLVPASQQVEVRSHIKRNQHKNGVFSIICSNNKRFVFRALL